jgi:hypothetical protein
MNFLTGEVTAIRLQNGLAGEGAAHRAGVAILSGHTPFEDAREESQKASHGNSMTRDYFRTNIV